MEKPKNIIIISRILNTHSLATIIY